MSIDRDCDERQSRLDWMIDEFRKARTRRLTKTTDTAVAVESQVASDRKAAAARSATSE